MIKLDDSHMKGCSLIKLLLTGGAGFIGSHTLVELLKAGYEIVVLDNLCNSSRISLDRVQKISGRYVTFVRGDIRDIYLLSKLFSDHKFDAVMHFAGLKAVDESVEQPLTYYNNNVFGSMQLFKAITANVKTIIFIFKQFMETQQNNLKREDVNG